jgi:hypothetical protein
MPPACTYWHSEAALCLCMNRRHISMSAPESKTEDSKRELKSPKTASSIIVDFGARNFSTIPGILSPFIDMIRCPAALALNITRHASIIFNLPASHITTLFTRPFPRYAQALLSAGVFWDPVRPAHWGVTRCRDSRSLYQSRRSGLRRSCRSKGLPEVVPVQRDS